MCKELSIRAGTPSMWGVVINSMNSAPEKALLNLSASGKNKFLSGCECTHFVIRGKYNLYMQKYEFQKHWVKEATHKRVHTIWFCLYVSQKQAEIVSETGCYRWEGKGRMAGKEAQQNFLGWWKWSPSSLGGWTMDTQNGNYSSNWTLKTCIFYWT